MTAPPIAILGAGMMTGVGLTAPAACAAIRCAIDNFGETEFISKKGGRIIASEIPTEPPLFGGPKLEAMLSSAICECLEVVPDASVGEVPIFVCVAEEERHGRLAGINEFLLDGLSREIESTLNSVCGLIARGRVGGAVGLQAARKLLYRSEHAPEYVVVAGVDSFLTRGTIASFDSRDRILANSNSNGFIPGEAAGAILLGRPEAARQGDLLCLGMGFGRESATIESEEPLRADGLVAAITAALDEAEIDLGDLDYRLSDVNGEQYGFKEAALALTRMLRKRKHGFDIWHPADCIGEVGAAVLPCMLGVALFAARKGYAPGPGVLCHLGNDDGKRAALVIRRLGGATDG